MSRLNVAKARAAGISNREIEQFLMDNPDVGIKGSLGDFAMNIPRSAAQAGKDIVSAVTNPGRTLSALGRTLLGGAQNLLPGEQGNEQYFNDVARYYGNRYGITPALQGDFGQAGRNLYRTAYLDPTGVALDAAGLAGAVGTGARAAGAVGKSSRLANFGDDAVRFANRIDPIYQSGKLASRGVRSVASGVDDFSKRYVTAGLGNPQTLGGVKKYGVNAADLFNQYPDLMQRDPSVARSLKDALGAQYDNIARAKTSILSQDDLAKLAKSFDNEINNLTRSLQINPNNPQIANQLAQTKRLRQNLSKQILSNMDEFGNVPVQPMREFRQTVTGTPSRLNSQNVQGSALADEFARRQTRSAINSADPRLERLGLHMAALGDNKRGIIKVLESAANRGEVAKPINVGNLGASGFGFGAGSFLGGPVGAAVGAGVGVAAKNYINSPTGVRQISRGVRTVGTGLQRGTNIAGQVAPRVYPTIRTADLINPNLPDNQQPNVQEPATRSRQTQPRNLQRSETLQSPQNTTIKLFSDRRRKAI